MYSEVFHEQNKTIVMISHDLASIKQTVHRMIYLEENIHFDGPTSEFPGLSSLAKLRGINLRATEDKNLDSGKTEENQITAAISNSGGQ